MTAVIIAIICIILIVLDITGHRKYQVKRKLPDWFFLCAFAAGAALCIILAVLGFTSKENERNTGQYLAYRYLMDGDTDGARSIIIQDAKISSTQKGFLEMLASGMDGDYRRMYFAADEFLSDPSELPEQEKTAEKLYTIAMNAVADGTNQKKAVEECVLESYEAAGITETVELQEYYELDKKIRDYDTEGIPAGKINALVKSFPEENSVKKLAISYYVLTDDFDQAISIAEELLDKDNSAASQILLTDVYAQMAYQQTEGQIRSMEDKEIADLVKKSDAAAQKAAGYDADNENAAKQNELAASYLEDATEVFYQRIENYLNVKKPFIGDKTGLYDLQLAKMLFLKGERDEAGEIFEKVLKNASELDETSPVREDLLQLSADLKFFLQDGEEEYREAVFNDCYEVFRSQSQDVIKTSGIDINRDASAQFAAMMLYDREIFEITAIDASAYPKVNVRLNTNVQKDNIFGGSGEFYKDDFRIRENELSMDDYSLTANIGVGERSLVFACDFVNGDELLQQELRSALLLAGENKTARRLAVINGDASAISTFDDSKIRYRTAAREAQITSNASAYEIISAGCAVLAEKKNEDRAMLFVSDDPAVLEENAGEILALLKENGVRCYILALEGLDPAAAEIIAEGSGGMSFVCSRAEELPAAVSMVADIMNNEYQFTYKAGEEDISGRRAVTVELINEELSAEGEYLREGVS